MPPVSGPWSPSLRRLWSCEVASGRAWRPSAITMKLDSEIGSIECGKRADFCVLEDDPTTAAPEALKDLRIWGTVQGGRAFAAG